MTSIKWVTLFNYERMRKMQNTRSTQRNRDLSTILYLQDQLQTFEKYTSTHEFIKSLINAEMLVDVIEIDQTAIWGQVRGCLQEVRKTSVEHDFNQILKVISMMIY